MTKKVYKGKVPTVNISFDSGTHKQWKKYTGVKLFKELTVILAKETKNTGRATGSVRVVYQKDPDGDFQTRFHFHSAEDCLYKLKPTIEDDLLEWFYES